MLSDHDKLREPADKLTLDNIKSFYHVLAMSIWFQRVILAICMLEKGMQSLAVLREYCQTFEPSLKLSGLISLQRE
jgi:hypothetical protein